MHLVMDMLTNALAMQLQLPLPQPQPLHSRHAWGMQYEFLFVTCLDQIEANELENGVSI